MSDPVASRIVFYIPGYDPFPPRRYRELYRREGAAQAAISGYTLSQSKGAGAGWNVSAEIEGHKVESRFEVLVWSDIVQGSMGAGIGATYLQLARTAWIYLASGALRRMMWLRKGPILAALYPVGMLLAQALTGWVLGRVLGMALTTLTGWAWLGWILTFAVLIAVLHGFRRLDHRLYAYYLMHDFAHAAGHRGAIPPDLAPRLRDFQGRIAAAFDEGADEVLVVGHSSGAHLAVTVLAALLREGRVPRGARLGFLSLGHVVPMLSFLPRAQGLRRDLHQLAASDRLTWVDVSAPGDGCCFALCDPVAVSGVAPANPHGPLVISAAFTRTLAPETWEKLRWRFFRLHFQYLCAFDRPGIYDYFAITAGPRTLAGRFEGVAPSPSRIDVVASRHVDMAP